MLLTVGHGTLAAVDLSELLRKAGVSLLVDIRRFPGSRAHPHLGREALAAWLPDAGIDYRWEERLGGRRSGADGDVDAWWRVAAFRAYAAYLRTGDAQRALDDVLADARVRSTAVMCSETLWWRCHRRLVADAVLLARATEVRHLGHDGRLAPHEPAAGARIGPDGLLRYPATAAGGNGRG